MPLILCLKKLAILFYDCLRIFSYWIPKKWHVRHLNDYTSKPAKVEDLTQKVRKGNIYPENWD